MPEHQHILIFDDDTKVLLIMRATLEKLGTAYKVATAEDGWEVFSKTKNQPFDLIISDVRMPGIDGIQLVEMIQALNTETAIIWITAYGCENLKAECERLSGSGCLEKPLRINEIRQAVLAVLDVDSGLKKQSSECPSSEMPGWLVRYCRPVFRGRLHDAHELAQTSKAQKLRGALSRCSEIDHGFIIRER